MHISPAVLAQESLNIIIDSGRQLKARARASFGEVDELFECQVLGP